MEALTEHSLVTEVATGTFCFKNKISASSVATLWEKISRFVAGKTPGSPPPLGGQEAMCVSVYRADALKQQKGVLVPNLGTFTVGPVVGETRKKVRPTFMLLETRYAGVSQERPKYAIGESSFTHESMLPSTYDKSATERSLSPSTHSTYTTITT